MPDLSIGQIFDVSGFPPRWLCGEWSAIHGWTHIGADLAIFGAYMAIPLSIALFMWKKRQVQLPALWWLFAAFILSCGVTHLIEASIFWYPWYRLSATMKVITAVASWATVIVIYRSLPVAAQLPGLAQLNRELRRSERSLSITLNSIGDAVLATDEQGRVTRINPVAEALTGWQESEALGRPVDEVFRIIREEASVPNDAIAKTSRRTELAAPTILVSRDGTKRLVEDSSSPIRDGGGKIRGTVLVFRDVTERASEAEAERHQLEKSMRFKSVLLELRDEVVDGRERFCRHLTERVAEVLEVDRISVWFCDEACSEMILEDAYIRRKKTHESGRRVSRSECPAYFAAIQRPGVISAVDARADEITGDFSREYFDPEVIVSTLDAPIRQGREPAGVVWCEEGGGGRQWTQAEEEFLSGVATTIEVVLQAEMRRAAEGEVRRLNGDLRGMIDERTAELRDQKGLMARLLDNLTEGVVACDENGRLSFFNQTARGWHGRELVSAEPDQLPDLFDLFEADGVTPMAPERVPLMRAWRGEQVRGAEMVIQAEGQGRRVVVCNGDPLTGANGENLGAVTAMRDVSLRRMAEAELSQAGERMKLAVESGEVGIWEFRDGEKYLIWNDQMFAIYGLDQEQEFDVDYAKWKTFVHPDDVERIDREFLVAWRGTASTFAGGFRIVRPDGGIRYLRASSKIFRDGQGRGIRVLGTNLDVTEERSREDALALALENQTQLTLSAQAGERAKSQFLAVMSHELRTPMNAVIGFSELLKESGTLSEDDRESLETVTRSGERMLRIVDDVLDFSRMGSGHFTVEKAMFSPADLAAEVGRLLRGLAQEKGLDLEMEVAPGVPRQVVGDAGRTKQILVNLINNGIKFTNSGSVTLRVAFHPESEAGPKLEFEVEDSGCGLMVENAELIFEPFRQVDSGLDRRHGGTGLGLAISRGLAEAMGGSIGFETDAGRGTTFRVTLPFPAARASEDPVVEPEPQVSGDSFAAEYPLRVLVAEDDWVNLRLVTSVLGKLGYSPNKAADGVEAVAVFEREGADLILMDLQMPRMDGIEATERIRQNEAARPGAPAVFISALTANILPEHRERCLNSGMEAFLYKPLRRKLLEDVLRNAYAAKLERGKAEENGIGLREAANGAGPSRRNADC